MPIGRRHYRITLADALSAHDRALLTGGRAGIHDLDALLSAIGRPYTGYYRSIVSKAAALLQSIATNHAFNDGNKREHHPYGSRVGQKWLPLGAS